MEAKPGNDDSDSEAKPDTQPRFVSRNVMKNVNLAKIIINISDCQYPVVRAVAKELKWKVQTDPQRVDWDVWWTDNAVLPETVFRMLPHQKINHFPGMYIIARKNLLGKGLMKLRKSFPEEFDFFPLTWMLPSEYSEFRLYFESKPKGKSRTFIVKPEAMSQGKGIFLTRRIEDIPQGEHFVVQRYLHKPYLVDGLKFDFRIYVLLAGVDPLRVYLYNQGLARFATETYIVPCGENMQNACMHLTNYAINKDNPNFVFNKTEKDMGVGHKRSLASVYDLLASRGVDVALLKERIKEIVVKTLISGLPLMRHQYRSSQVENYASNMCFQILGFDILLDSKAQPYLLEVNHTPSFMTDTPLDQLIKKNLIKDSLILMNINTKIKSEAIERKKEELNQKAMNIKRPKISDQEKELLRAQQQKLRDEYQLANLGGFQRIYPTTITKTAAKYQQLIDFTRRLFEQSFGIRKKPVVKEKNPDPPPKPTSKLTPGKAQQRNPLKQPKLSLDQPILPYLKTIQKSIFQQFRAPPAVEFSENNLALVPQINEPDRVSYEKVDSRFSNIKIAKNVPSQEQIVKLFNKSYLQYKILKQELRRNRLSSQKETQPDSYHQIDAQLHQGGDEFSRQFQQDQTKGDLHNFAGIEGVGVIDGKSRRNFSHKARITDGDRTFQNRSTLASISKARRFQDEPLSAGLPK